MRNHSGKPGRKRRKERCIADEFLEKLGIGTIHLDRSFRVKGVNAAARNMLQQSEEDLLGKALRKAMPGPLSREISGAAGQALKENTLVSFTVRSPFPGNLLLFARCMPSGDGVTTILEDVNIFRPSMQERSERERQELEKLYEEMESELIKLEAVLEQLPSGVTIVEAPSGRLLYHNAQGDKLLGHPIIVTENYQGYVQYGALHQDGTVYRPEEYPIARALLGESTTMEEIPYRRGDGTLTYLSISASPIRDLEGNIVAAVSIFNDVAGRKRAEDALRESEERLRNIVENSTNVFYSHTVDHRLIYLSPQFEKIFGYDPKDRMLLWTDTITDNPVNEKGIHATEEAIRTGRPQPTYEMELKAQEGRRIWVEVNESPVVRDGKTVMMVGALQDITERKKAEKERMEMERRFQQSQKLESLGIMAGGIAHDFNNLLTAILGNLDLALLGGPQNPRAQAFLEQARTATLRASDLTSQMLAYSGKGKFHVKTFNLSGLVDEVAGLLKASISKTASLILSTDKSIPFIKADPTQIQQIIMNLIVNASEAIGSQPGIISVTTGTQDCDEHCLEQSRLREKPRPGKYVFFEVRDTGCGMDEKTLERLFDPFFTTKFTGRGLGMAAVLGIVEAHRGAIMLQSEPGKGTTIKVLFPVLDPAEQSGTAGAGRAPVAADAEPRPEYASDTVLVVDDEDMVLNLCTAMVEQLGFRALRASDGKEALEVFRRHAREISLVILDLTMPRMDGAAAFQELKRIRRDIKVIVSSGFSEQEISHHFSGDEPAGFIEKPFEFKSLQEKIRTVLRKG
jgi:PAS domain S-box-containing protein